jgi:hypothetical protein
MLATSELDKIPPSGICFRAMGVVVGIALKGIRDVQHLGASL